MSASTIPQGNVSRTLPIAPKWLYLSLLVVCVALLVTAGWGSLRDRHLALRQGGALTLNLATALAGQTARTIDAVTLALDLAAIELDKHDVLNTPSDLVSRKLAAAVAGVPALHSIVVFDEIGRVVQNSQPQPGPGVNAATREHFVHLRDHADAHHRIGTPFVLPGLDKQVIPVARRLVHADGSFAGIIEGMIPVEHFEQIYRGIDLGKNGALALLNVDSTLFARQPAVPALTGKKLSGFALFTEHLPKAPRGTHELVSPADGTLRVVSYQRLDRHPFVMMVAVDKEESLAAWYEQTTIHLGIMTAVLTAVFLLGAGMIEQLRRRSSSERRLVAAKAEADAANEAKSRFLAVMSHELRTPLTGVIGLADLLIEDELSGPRREQLGLLRSSARSLQSLLNDLLDLAKIESGKLTLERIDFDPSDVVHDAIELFSALASASGNVLSASVQGLPARVNGDPTRLRQVLLNLIGNAVKFTKNGRITVTATAQDDGCTLCFAVSDTGIGLTEEAKRHLFEAFTQADSSTTRRFGGTGLGLAVCKHLVEAMGGQLAADGAPGKGAVFSFSAQVACAQHSEPQTDEPSAPVEPAVAAVVHSSQRSASILLAEDNAINRMLIAGMLQRFGHVVDVVENGRQAVDAVLAKDYDLILTDMHMPVMDGFEATCAIRALPSDKARLPVIALTADLGMASNAAAQTVFDAFLPKPIDWNAITATIDELLRSRSVVHGAAPASASLPADNAGTAPAAAPTSTEQPPADPTIDRQRIDQLRNALGDDGVAVLIEEVPADLCRLVEAIEVTARTRDLGAVARHAHALFGVASNFGCSLLATAARRLEHDAASAEALDQVRRNLVVTIEALAQLKITNQLPAV